VQGERGAHIIMAPEVAEYIAGSLASVRSVPVKNTPIPLAELGVRPPVKKEVGSGCGDVLSLRARDCTKLWIPSNMTDAIR
jgi:RNA-binding protein YlmH